MKFRIIDHVDHHTLDMMYGDYPPVFVLSTGRSGSQYITALLNQASNLSAFHEPHPTLQYFADYSQHLAPDSGILRPMFQAARMESILEVYIRDKIYVESNQCLTFWGPTIAELFPKSRFIHLIRHPGDFVCSAIRKGWFLNDSIWEIGRPKLKDEKQWQVMDQIEKLAWLWNRINSFIDDWFVSLSSERVLTIKLEELVATRSELEKLMDFIGAEQVNWSELLRIQPFRINRNSIAPDEPPTMKKRAYYPEYREWNSDMKKMLIQYAGQKAREYGYSV